MIDTFLPESISLLMPDVLKNTTAKGVHPLGGHKIQNIPPFGGGLTYQAQAYSSYGSKPTSLMNNTNTPVINIDNEGKLNVNPNLE